MFDDEGSSKKFLTLENSKSSYNNNVSHLEVEDEIIDNTTDPPTKKKVKTITTEPKKILEELSTPSSNYSSKFQAEAGS